MKKFGKSILTGMLLLLGAGFVQAAPVPFDCDGDGPGQAECTQDWLAEGELPTLTPVVKSIPKPSPKFIAPRKEAEEVTPTPSVMVMSNGDLGKMERGHLEVRETRFSRPSYEASSEPREEKKGLVGPTLGYHGPRKKIKSYAGSTIETWTYLPAQVRYQ